MVIKKTKEINETSIEKNWRLADEKKAKDKATAEQKIIDVANEQKRKEDIIFPYLDILTEQLVEKSNASFWTFPDRSGFKKIKNTNFNQMKKLTSEKSERYKNRTAVNIMIATYHRSKIDTKYAHKNIGIFLICSISVHPINSKGEITDNVWSCTFKWNADDFKTTKFSFKLIEQMMIPIYRKQITCASLLGFPVTDVIADMKKLKDIDGKYYNFDDLLHPLAGI